ncbi:hypothetical protein [Shewanella sp.]|uniref:hypothetical protein n=1 Tax=Shewanella sp. TaxID=50422 RepID=UPI003A9811DF
MRHLWLAMLSVGFTLPAMASVEQSLQQCVQITNDTQRLACFDELSASINTANIQIEVATPATSSVPSPSSSAVDRFGAKPKEAINEPDEIKLTVASINKSPRGALIITFENGQIWRQLQAQRYRLRPGDKVTIEKAALGSFLLRAEGRNQSTRVQREQ